MDISKCFTGSLRLRDNESWLYINWEWEWTAFTYMVKSKQVLFYVDTAFAFHAEGRGFEHIAGTCPNVFPIRQARIFAPILLWAEQNGIRVEVVIASALLNRQNYTCARKILHTLRLWNRYVFVQWDACLIKQANWKKYYMKLVG